MGDNVVNILRHGNSNPLDKITVIPDCKLIHLRKSHQVWLCLLSYFKRHELILDQSPHPLFPG